MYVKQLLEDLSEAVNQWMVSTTGCLVGACGAPPGRGADNLGHPYTKIKKGSDVLIESAQNWSLPNDDEYFFFL